MIQAEEAGLSLRLASATRMICCPRNACVISVFVQELGATGRLVDHKAKLEKDDFDEVFEHLVADRRGAGRALGWTMLSGSTGSSDFRADAACGALFIRKTEFDLSPLKSSGRKLVELGRSCVHPDYRGGAAMFLLWNGLAEFVLERGIEVMFGAASFHGTDAAPWPSALSFLHHNHLAPEGLRVSARGPNRLDMALVPEADLSRGRAMAKGSGPDQGLSASGWFCRRRGLYRPRLQHHRCLSGDRHRKDERAPP